MKTHTPCLVLLLVFCTFVLSVCSQTTKKPSTPQSKNENPKLIINFYLENSGSMTGYFGANTSFTNCIFNYANQLKNQASAFHFIKTATTQLPKHFQSYITALSPTSSSTLQSNAGVSDMAELLRKIISTNKDTISVFISDCIFSPRTGQNSDDYLLAQKMNIQNLIGTTLDSNKNFGIIIYQLESPFTGSYWNKNNVVENLSGQNRPYYIWVMGSVEHLIKIKNSISLQDVESTYMISNKSLQNNGKLVVGQNNYSPCQANNGSICLSNLRRLDGVASFFINLDAKNLLLPASYLSNISNYSISSVYQIAEIHRTNHTYRLKVTANTPIKGDYTIELKNKKPTLWINSLNDSNGVGIIANQLLGKTYGFSFLIDGVYDGFNASQGNYSKFKIQIK